VNWLPGGISCSLRMPPTDRARRFGRSAARSTSSAARFDGSFRTAAPAPNPEEAAYSNRGRDLVEDGPAPVCAAPAAALTWIAPTESESVHVTQVERL
jgi:hypothetical protein